MEETITPFTLFQFFSFAVWYNNDYVGYANVILFMTFTSICISVYETRKQNKRIRKMSFYDQPIYVQRRNEKTLQFDLLKISCLEIQIGDLVFINPGEKVPADILLLSGKCVIDESLITGEIDSLFKTRSFGIIRFGQ